MTRGRQNAERSRKQLRKPKPPGHLTDAEAAIWTRMCASQTGAWCELVSASSLLERYCQARAYYDALVAHRLAVLAAPEDGDKPPPITAAASITEEITKADQALLRLERAMRLTPQSRQEAKGTKNDPPDPWGRFPDDGDTA